VDGASNNKGAGIGFVLVTPEGSIIEQSYTLGFPATNNEAEYEAVVASLRMAETFSLRTRGLLRLASSGEPSQRGVCSQGRTDGGVPSAHSQFEVQVSPMRFQTSPSIKKQSC